MKIEQPDPKVLSDFYKSNSFLETAAHFKVSKSTLGNWFKLNKIRKQKQIKINFTDIQESVLIGSMLGDGSITKPKNNLCNSCYTETHCLAQKPYADWKYEVLQPYSSSRASYDCFGIKIKNGKLHRDTEKTLYGCRFATIKHQLFTSLESKWYLRDKHNQHILNNGKRIKCLPVDLTLTPLAIAVWYMDDGCNSPKDRTVVLCTDSFSKMECNRLVAILGSYSIRAGVQTSGRIFIRTTSYLDFINLVTPFITPCLLYKIDLSKYTKPMSMFGIGHPNCSTNIETINEIRQMAKDNIPQKQISKNLNVNYKTVNNILCGRTWSHNQTDHQNSLNYNNSSGVNGVHKVNHGWQARITIKSKKVYLGTFKNKKDAEKIRKKAEILKNDGETNIIKFKQINCELNLTTG